MKWLKEIHDYIAIDNKIIAKRVIEGIFKRVEFLETFPRMGQRLLDWDKDEIRLITYGHYRIVYLVKSEEQIDILGIYHGSLDLKNHFKKE